MPDDDGWIEDARSFLKTQRGDRAAAGGTRLGLSGTLVSMGVDGFSMALYDDPGLIDEVLDRYVRFAKRTVQVFCELGFDFIWTFDDFAYRTGPMFSPQVFRDRIAPKLKEVADLIELPWIFHSDGNLFPVLDDLLDLGIDGLHPIEPEAMDLAETKRALQGRCCAVGNVSVDLLARGTPQEVRQAVERCFEAGAPGGGYMISTGNCIPAYAKIENVRAYLGAVAEMRYGQT
jgi:uroporphyrinogen decarboxylase